MNNDKINKYKPYLRQYLQARGIQVPEFGNIRCINPKHNDANASMGISDNVFHCFGCDCSGDIYKAVELLEGITDFKKQVEFVEKFFDGTVSNLPEINKTYKKKPKFVAHLDSIHKVELYLQNNADQEKVKAWLKYRAQISSNNEIQDYPEEIKNKMVNGLYYWPGYATAAKALGSSTLAKAGIFCSNQYNKIWKQPGVVAKLQRGFKIMAYVGNKCEKKGSADFVTFPTPKKSLANLDQIVIVEGEIDAIAANAAGIENVFAAGGVNLLTEERIKDFIIPANIKSIVIMFDNDKEGHKKGGYVYTPRTAKPNNLPRILIAAGYTGKIKIADLSQFGEYKDSDEIVLHNEVERIRNAIKNAKEWQEIPEKENKKIVKGSLSLKILKKLLDKIPLDTLDSEDVQPFIDAFFNASNYDTATINKLLSDWGATAFQLEQKHNVAPIYLCDIGYKYNLSRHYLDTIKNACLSKADVQQIIGLSDNDKIKIDISKLDQDDLTRFIDIKEEFAAANLLEQLLEDRLIFDESTDCFYSFNGLVWTHQSDANWIAYNYLSAILKELLKKAKDEDNSKYFSKLLKVKSTLGKYSFCKTVMKALSEKPTIFRKMVTFDGANIAETLTLQDSVLDFSGKKIVFRKARPQEYRKHQLPYFRADVENAPTPEKFLQFMRGNFEKPTEEELHGKLETMETLFYFLSLIGSRKATFKVGGFFIGQGNTGKTTTIRIIEEIYAGMCQKMDSKFIMVANRYGSSINEGAERAKLESAGVAISDETQRNDSLNGSLFKELTGGGIMTARPLYSPPRQFAPTAQLIISTNFAPKFDAKDQATINRMVVIPFKVAHNPGDANTISEADIFAMLRPEYGAIVKMFAEYYIRLKTEHKNKIPLSWECEEHKKDYIEGQETSLDRFVSENIEFVRNEKEWVPLKELYHRYCAFYNIALDASGNPQDREDWTQNKFTRFMRADYPQFKVKQKRVPGEIAPVQIAYNIRLKEITPVQSEKEVFEQQTPTAPTTQAQQTQYTQSQTQQTQAQSTQKQMPYVYHSSQTQLQFKDQPMPTDDPFADDEQDKPPDGPPDPPEVYIY